jgi:Domain of unknown function (DUF5664)
MKKKPQKGLKFDDDKPMLAYIPKSALWEEGKAFSHGAKKYKDWNYKNGLAIVRTLSAALRHIEQFLDGEDYDFDPKCKGCIKKKCKKHSGAHHLGCGRAGLGMALDTYFNHKELDDRYKK